MDGKFEQEVKEMLENKVQEEAASLLGEKVKAISELLEQQLPSCDNQYDIGLYNGLALGKATLTGETPQFYDDRIKEEK